MTSDEYPVYETAIHNTFGEPVPAERKFRAGPGSCPSGGCRRAWSTRRCTSTAERGRLSWRMSPRLVFGSEDQLEEPLGESCASRVVNTSFVERQNATDRHRNARKGRKTYRFSKDWQVHEAMTYLTLYGYNFCWCVRTLRVKDEEGRWQERTPALAAGLTDHVWTWREWFTRPAVQPA